MSKIYCSATYVLHGDPQEELLIQRAEEVIKTASENWAKSEGKKILRMAIKRSTNIEEGREEFVALLECDE